MKRFVLSKEEKETVGSFLCAIFFCALMFFVIVLNSILTK